MNRKIVWFLFFGALALTFVLKAVQLGWFDPRPPLQLDNQPALLFFNKSRGCECELFVYKNANAQINAWNVPVQVVHIDPELRPDLAQQFGVIRAPSLVLLNAAGQVAMNASCFSLGKNILCGRGAGERMQTSCLLS